MQCVVTLYIEAPKPSNLMKLKQTLSHLLSKTYIHQIKCYIYKALQWMPLNIPFSLKVYLLNREHPTLLPSLRVTDIAPGCSNADNNRCQQRLMRCQQNKHHHKRWPLFERYQQLVTLIGIVAAFGRFCARPTLYAKNLQRKRDPGKAVPITNSLRRSIYPITQEDT